MGTGKSWSSIFKALRAKNTEKHWSHRSLGLTVIVDCKWDVGCDDVIEADLAVLRWAVSIQSFHTHDAIEKTTFRDGRLVTMLNKHGGELVHVVHTHMYCGPVRCRNRNTLRHWDGEIEKGEVRDREKLYITEYYTTKTHLLYTFTKWYLDAKQYLSSEGQSFSYLCDFLLLVPSGPSPQS